MAAFVEQVYVKPSVPPVIVVTEVGHLVSSNSLGCGMALDKSSNKPVLKLFNLNGEIIEEEDVSKKNKGKNYLILRNKKTNRVSIYGMKTTFFKKPDYLKRGTIESQSVNKNDEFNLVFGTKKSSRAYKSRINNEINVTTEIFKNISSNAEMLTSMNSESNEFSKYLPLGYNRSSNEIENIYPVSSLLMANEIDLMTDYSKELLNMLPLPNDIEDFSQFFIENVNRLTDKTVQNICLLTFADGLVELLKTKSANLNYRNNEIYPYSEVINDKLMDNFLEYNVTGCDLTSKMKDKAICHIIIILVIINMNVVDLSWVSPYLPQTYQKRLVLLMKVVGVTPLKDNKTKYSLKLPLPPLPTFQKQPKRPR